MKKKEGFNNFVITYEGIKIEIENGVLVKESQFTQDKLHNIGSAEAVKYLFYSDNRESFTGYMW